MSESGKAHPGGHVQIPYFSGPGITFQAMLLFIPRMLSVLNVEMLVHGNATAAEVHMARIMMKGRAPPACKNGAWRRVVPSSI